MPSTSRWLTRIVTLVFALALLAGTLPAPAAAATKLFVVANELAQIWRVDPVTGNKLSSFSLVPPVGSARSGLGFDGTFLYYTDENLAVIQAYTEAGVLDHTFPKPVGDEPGTGIAATKTSVFLVGLDNVINELDSTTGAIVNTFTIPGAAHALAFAGSLDRLLVVLNDSTTIQKLKLDGSTDGTITGPDIFRGLAFSSSSNTIFGVRQGFLWASNTSGALLPGYPVQIHDDVTNLKLLKSAAAAADEPVLESCGDGTVNVSGETCEPPNSTQTNGNVCRLDCTYCGDGNKDVGANEECDDGNTDNTDACRNNCTLPSCGDGTKDANELCDDGNTVNGDGCSSICQPEPRCGDGIIDLQLGEQCDPPNVPGCDANCHATEICTDLVDNDGDGQIDCFDEDCDCLPIGKDPGVIRFGRPGTGTLFAVHGSFQAEIEPTQDDITFLLTNDDGKNEIYELFIPGTDVKQIGRNLFRYRNKVNQQKRDGLARFDIRFFPKRNAYTFVLKTYGDLSEATLAKMGLQMLIGDDAFVNVSTWEKTPKGWKLVLPGEH